MTNQVLMTLKHLWQSLDAWNLPMAIMGGIALSAWKHMRTTHDVDVLIALNGRSPEEVFSLLQQRGFRPKRMPLITPVGDLRFMQLLFEPPEAFMDFQVDLLLADSDYQKTALSRRVLRRLPAADFDTYVLTCEDMVLHKLKAGRVLDRADAAHLLRINRGGIDFIYLGKWVHELRLQPEWLEVWQDAFPGETSPFQVA